jgi:hypothetical protein
MTVEEIREELRDYKSNGFNRNAPAGRFQALKTALAEKERTGDEEGDEENGVVARFPENGHTVRTENGEHVVYKTGDDYSQRPENRTDILTHPEQEDSRDTMGSKNPMDRRSRDSRSGPPESLAELNALNKKHYARDRITPSGPVRSLAQLNIANRAYYKGGRR